MMDVDFLPHHLIIVGGSYIGLEFGQMYRRFGSQVTAFGIQPHIDAPALDDVFVRRRDASAPSSAATRSSSKVDCTAGAPEVAGSHLLLAVGRPPNTDDLDLDKAGVRCDERGYIIVDDRLQTTAPGIWALGDCNGKGAFTHTAYNDFEVVAAKFARPRPAQGQRAYHRICPLHRPAIGPRRHEFGRGTQ